MTIGEKIKYCRQKRGLTQKQLADASAIHPVSIRKYETDRMEPQPEQLYRIAKALNISYAALSNIRMTGLRMHTVGDLNGILMALVEARFLLYQNGELRFNPILEPYLKLENEKSYAIPISDLRVVPKIPSLVRGDYDIISFDGEPDAREKLELDQQLLENELEVNKKGGSNMTIGNKIRVLRRFRGMTQKELGIAIGLPNNGADNRITQYENNYRIPKKEVLAKLPVLYKLILSFFRWKAQARYKISYMHYCGWRKNAPVQSACFRLNNMLIIANPHSLTIQ